MNINDNIIDKNNAKEIARKNVEIINSNIFLSGFKKEKIGYFYSE